MDVRRVWARGLHRSSLRGFCAARLRGARAKTLAKESDQLSAISRQPEAAGGQKAPFWASGASRKQFSAPPDGSGVPRQVSAAPLTIPGAAPTDSGAPPDVYAVPLEVPDAPREVSGVPPAGSGVPLKVSDARREVSGVPLEVSGAPRNAAGAEGFGASA